ncbi:hypothetical protein LTR85_006515 [Meristemomyces frigidus]|nr:hypothetical protein LTR85_006515 [Meristemomyces frigidus]
MQLQLQPQLQQQPQPQRSQQDLRPTEAEKRAPKPWRNYATRVEGRLPRSLIVDYALEAGIKVLSANKSRIVRLALEDSQAGQDALQSLRPLGPGVQALPQALTQPTAANQQAGAGYQRAASPVQPWLDIGETWEAYWTRMACTDEDTIRRT